MNIIIVGCGKVGFAIANQLTDEGHQITIIDSDSARLERACSTLDTIGIVGNGTVYNVLQEAGIEDADIFIAVTKYDEVNLLSCVIAKKAGKCQTIARVTSPEYYDEISFLKEELGISYAFNPEFMTAREIFTLIHLPSALEIDTFAKGKVNLIKIKIPENSILDNMSLKEFSFKISHDVLVCTVERNKEIIIPDGNFILHSGDTISFTTLMKYAYSFLSKVGIKAHPIKNVVIAGGGRISYYLAGMLLKSKVTVKIIENDKERCELLSELLPDAMLINGDINDADLLLEEGIASTDAIVALSEYDEDNIVLSLYSSKVSNAKIITKINKSEYFSVFEDLPGSEVCPRNITSEAIISYVRSLTQAYGSNVETLHKLFDNKVEALEFNIEENAKVINTPLNSLKLKSNLLLCNISRGKQVIKPRGDDIIMPGDSVVIVTTIKGLNSIDDILAK